MTSSSTGAKNQPHFADADAPDVAVNPTQVADYAAKVGNRRVGTFGERQAASANDVWDGLAWFDTNENAEYIYRAGAWRLLSRPPITVTPSVTGLGLGTSGGSLMYAYESVANGELTMRVGWRLGSSPSVNDVQVTPSVPPAAWLPDLTPLGSATFYDMSAAGSGRILGTVYKISGTTARVAYAGAANAMLTLTAAAPFPWAANDEIHALIRYPV